ncbi:MAG: toll/interleukin-1 receptor domain-containing protein [Candidatus Binatia bacterium]
MANPEHVSVLIQGGQIWRAWRKENPSIQLDLAGASLIAVDLRGADLTGANMAGANLSASDLTAVNFSEANLTFANLSFSPLSLARLCKANLSVAIFSATALLSTDLSEATLNETIFVNVDLSQVKGLNACQHRGPSVIDHRTFMRSGTLPLVFLRGCGLPDIFVEYLPSLFNTPIQFYSCFISYSSKDEEFAQRLYADLQNKGVRGWFAPEDMKIEDEFRSRIDQAIHVHDRLLLILSEHSVNSRWVQKEVETAFEKEEREKRLVLFSVRVDEAVMDSTVGWAADIRRQRHVGDFRQWKDHDPYQRAFSRLLRDLKPEIVGFVLFGGVRIRLS